MGNGRGSVTRGGNKEKIVCNRGSRGLRRGALCAVLHCLYDVSSLSLVTVTGPVIEPTVRSHPLYIATLLLAAASVFLLQSHLHPILNQMENGTLLSRRFEFPRSLLAADRTQICHRFLLLTLGQRRNQV